MEIYSLSEIIVSITLILLNTLYSNYTYNKKGLNVLIGIIILLAIKNPITITISIILTIYNLKITKERKVVFNEIRYNFTPERYCKIEHLTNSYDITRENFIDILKLHTMKKSEITFSILILSTTFLGLLLSPLVSIALIFITYLLSGIIKGLLKVSLNKTSTIKYILDSVEVELRTTNEKYIESVVKKYLKHIQ